MNVFIGFNAPEEVDRALRLLAAKRRVTRTEVLLAAIHVYLSITDNGQMEIAEILTDFHDGRETLDGAVERLTVITKKNELPTM